MSPESLQREARGNGAAPKQRRRRGYQKSGHYKRVRSYRSHGYSAIDGRTYAGKESKRWEAAAIKAKGGANCPFHILAEIRAAKFDFWLQLSLAEVIAQDAKERGAVINLRRKALPKLHEQYATIAARFARRCEALQLDKGADLATRLMQEQRERNDDEG
jgi:hypothetical protein